MVAFVCFLCPGMFNALSGLGGGGKSDPGLADKMVWLFVLCHMGSHLNASASFLATEANDSG